MSRVINALVDHEQERGTAQATRKWQKWLTLDQSRREWSIAVNRATEIDSWSQWSIDEKKRYAAILLSPFIVDDCSLMTFIEQVETAVE